MNEAFSCWKFALYEILQIGLLRDFAGPPINCGGPFLKFIVVCLRFIKNVWTLTYAEHFTMWHGDRWLYYILENLFVTTLIALLAWQEALLHCHAIGLLKVVSRNSKTIPDEGSSALFEQAKMFQKYLLDLCHDRSGRVLHIIPSLKIELNMIFSTNPNHIVNDVHKILWYA